MLRRVHRLCEQRIEVVGVPEFHRGAGANALEFVNVPTYIFDL